MCLDREYYQANHLEGEMRLHLQASILIDFSQNDPFSRLKFFMIKLVYSPTPLLKRLFLIIYNINAHFQNYFWLSASSQKPSTSSSSSPLHFLYLDYNQKYSMQLPSLSSITLTSKSLQYFSNASSLTHYTKDIVSGQYEGGFKLWQCTLDMLHFMQAQPHIFAEKRVLQIGCGHGLLGILASKINASHVCLQDYNCEVIDKLTKPTVLINKQPLQKFSFVHGDWQQLKCSGLRFDVIIGSQLIYNQQNYQKLYMSEKGCCILANKVYYFGVGGNMPAFKKCVQNSGLKLESLLKVSPPTGGNKKQIVKITY